MTYYWIEWYAGNRRRWVKIRRFDSADRALEVADERRRLHRRFDYAYRVVDDNGTLVVSATTIERIFPDLHNPQEENSMGDQQKLEIKRGDLIKRLEERAAEEQAARDAAQAAIDEGRKKLLALANDLTDDQVVNMIHHYVHSGEEAATKFLTDVIENDKFVSQDLKPTSMETTLEKQIRVLKLAQNETIEVGLGDPLYPYL